MDNEIQEDIENQINTKTGAKHLRDRKLKSYNVGRWGMIITVIVALGTVGYIFYKLDSFYAELGSEHRRARIEYERIDPEAENTEETEEQEETPPSNVTDDILNQ